MAGLHGWLHGWLHMPPVCWLAGWLHCCQIVCRADGWGCLADCMLGVAAGWLHAWSQGVSQRGRALRRRRAVCDTPSLGVSHDTPPRLRVVAGVETLVFEADSFVDL